MVAGLPVAKETFGRLGARFRPLVEDGARVGPGDAVGELGGPLAAMRGAAPTVGWAPTSIRRKPAGPGNASTPLGALWRPDSSICWDSLT